jgi:hypothetical protein
MSLRFTCRDDGSILLECDGESLVIEPWVLGFPRVPQVPKQTTPAPTTEQRPGSPKTPPHTMFRLRDPKDTPGNDSSFVTVEDLDRFPGFQDHLQSQGWPHAPSQSVINLKITPGTTVDLHRLASWMRTTQRSGSLNVDLWRVSEDPENR